MQLCACHVCSCVHAHNHVHSHRPLPGFGRSAKVIVTKLLLRLTRSQPRLVFLIQVVTWVNRKACNCRPLPGSKVLSKSTSTGSGQGSKQEPPPAAHLPNILDQGEDVMPAHPVQSPFEAGPPSPTPHPAPNTPFADLPTRHQGPAVRGPQPAEQKPVVAPSGSLLSPSGQDASMASPFGRDSPLMSPMGRGSSLVSPSGRDSSCTFTSHSGSDSGRVRTRAQTHTLHVIQRLYTFWSHCFYLFT